MTHSRYTELIAISSALLYYLSARAELLRYIMHAAKFIFYRFGERAYFWDAWAVYARSIYIHIRGIVQSAVLIIDANAVAIWFSWIFKCNSLGRGACTIIGILIMSVIIIRPICNPILLMRHLYVINYQLKSMSFIRRQLIAIIINKYCWDSRYVVSFRVRIFRLWLLTAISLMPPAVLNPY